ncbi:hypothetical protein FB008_12211 [Sinorhizobium medicae]|nr:hypothetical protein FB007_12456 [Sinorhizobium medicae]TWA46621.1 hypothetical protein FB008_12211 [Sinorhizobium medicae]
MCPNLRSIDYAHFQAGQRKTVDVSALYHKIAMCPFNYLRLFARTLFPLLLEILNGGYPGGKCPPGLRIADDGKASMF